MKRSLSSAFAAVLLGVALAAGLSSCASAPKSIPEDLTASELIQRAQEASDTNKYPVAVAYYQAALDRFGDDPAILCNAEYEIAFIAYKNGRLVEAEERFTRLLERYAAPEGDFLPARFKILAEKVLEKVRAARGTAKK